MQQAGMNKKGGSDAIIYTIIIIIIGVFVFNMKHIYNFTAELKNGGLFKKDNPTVEEPSTEEPSTEAPKEEQEKYEIVTPVGDKDLVCSFSETSDYSTGTKTVKVHLYSTDNKLKSINEIVAYEGIHEEYTNYIYSERKKYEKVKDLNIELKGFSIVTELNGTLSLSTSTVVDLSRAKISDIDFADYNDIFLYGELDQDINDVVSQYQMKGYECNG